jgi:hypothetical protein
MLGAQPAGVLLAPTVKVQGRKAILERYRNRIDDETIDHPFAEYWDVFVFKHQQRGNVMLHCIAVGMMHGAWIGLIATTNLWLLLLVPLSQVTGLVGHLVFERSHIDMRDLLFSWRASFCLNRMFLAVLRGQYWAEVDRVRTRFIEFKGASA